MMDANREKQRTFLEEFCAAHRGYDALDDLVHDLKSKEAAEINNGGIAAQLDYLLESLGGTEAARAIIGTDGELPDFFGANAPYAEGRSWQVVYRICAPDGEVIHTGSTSVRAATESDAGTWAVRWVHAHDPYADERIDYFVEIVHAHESEKDGDDDQDDPPG
jgi:hypothetical protein